jgi:nucleoside-diphosphate-sugar epimerase
MIFLTGASGWLGLNVVQSLTDGSAQTWGLAVDGIRGLVLPGTDTSKLKSVSSTAELAFGDIRSGAGLGEFFTGGKGGILIHTAGLIHPGKIRELYEVNRDGTRRLLDAAIAAGMHRAVIVSSNSSCGCNPHPDHLFDELSPYKPYMNYGRSKMEMELLALDYHRRGLIEVVLVRAPWFYGPHQPPRQVLFFEMVRDGKAPVIGSGENLRSMAYTENLAQGLILAAAVPKAAGEIYWIADERPYSMNEIIGTIERLLEEEFGQACVHKRLRLPSIASEVALMIDAILQKAGLYHQKIHVLSEMNKTIACRIDKAKRELGYAPDVALQEGMRRSLAAVFLKRGQ